MGGAVKIAFRIMACPERVEFVNAELHKLDGEDVKVFWDDREYPDRKKIAHCLSSSKSLFEKCGFTHYKTVCYKHGTQYFMRKEAEATDGAEL